jgi:hypothetical protein
MPTKLNSAGQEYDHYWPEDVPWTEAWRHHPDLLPDHSVDGFKTGDIVVWPDRYATPSALYWISATVYRLSCCDNPDDERARVDFLRPFVGEDNDRENGYTTGSLHLLRHHGPAANNNPTTPQPFAWPSPEVEAIVARHPRAEITRAILRRVYGTPPPADAVTKEALEQWAATQKVWTPPTPKATPTPLRRNNEQTILVQGSINGHTYGSCSYTENWSISGNVRVPLSVFEDGEDAVRDYVEDELRDRDGDRNYGEYEYNDHHSDGDEIDDTDIDLDYAMEEYERITAEENEEEED